jgi:hypothetical protein
MGTSRHKKVISLDYFFRKKFFNKYFNSLKHVNLVTESYANPAGSCCDDGRFRFRDCGNWWYYCREWGLGNYSTWVRFGPRGFTAPLATEHAARCEYRAERVVCPAPEDCKRRSARNVADICSEMPHIN